MQKLTVQEMNRISISEFKKAQKRPLILVSDNVRSQHNIGSFFRSADAFRIAGVWLCGISATPPSAEIHKTALGAEESVEWRYFDDTMEAVNALKAEGYEIWAVEQAKGSVILSDFKPESGKKYALIVGNEVHGVRQDVVDACTGCIEIPQFGTKHSLNVSVAAGIVLHHLSTIHCQLSTVN